MNEPLLDVASLEYAYPDGTPALRGVDLRVAAGEKVGLVGPNGSGKSTLLLCVGGLFYGKGTIRVNGTTLTRKTAQQLRGRVAIVFQSPDDQLFMPTLTDDLAFGPINLGLGEQDVQARVQQAADEMGLAELLDRPPHHLSMGQKRNAAIASVLTLQPDVLLMDEPSSNLDPRSRRRLIDVLAAMKTTILIASHDLALVGGLCERVAVIDRGRIVADGPTRQVLADPAIMEAHGLEVWQGHRPAIQ